MKRIIENKCIFIFGIIVGLIISVGGVYAATAIIESKEVAYDNSESHGTYTNIQDTIDELYERSGLRKTKWVDPVLNGADPVLKDSLIPVTIDSDGNVYYANEYTEWYNYKEKRWANAIILTDTAKEYKDDKKYKVGDHILEDDIESYFVWIPRYQYKIWNIGAYTKTLSLGDLKNSSADAKSEGALWKVTGNNTRIIDIKFGTADSVPKMSEGEAAIDKYYTHSAFTLGDKKLNGIWVGKFETGGTTDSLIVKSNVSSLRNKTVKVFFDAAKGYDNNLDSHMMKNTEWGAVAYLSHSEYGIGTEVNFNNATDYKTGYSASPGTNQSTFPSDSGSSSDETKTKLWNTPVGYLANTTGNISGVYDMSGGAQEVMAACIDGNFKDSGFDATTLKQEMDDGYIDKYDANSTQFSYNKRILGDATGEMGPFYSYYEGNGSSYNHSSWYGDYAYFVESTNPWFVRSGNWNAGVLGGQFYFYRNTGGANDIAGFRLVLSPTSKKE